MAKSGIEDRVSRRLKFRDLQVFFAVTASGSMAEAARQLNLTQPAVSEIIAQLEHLFGARLFDRSPRGVEATIFGRALLGRAHAALDEMKQGVRDIEFLADPTQGEVQIGCAQRLSAAIMPQIVERFSQAFPRVVLKIDELPPLTPELPGLRARKYDLLMGRTNKPFGEQYFADDINLEVLFDDRFIVASAGNSPWARRRKIDIAELAQARWVLTGPETFAYSGVAEAFRRSGLAMPNVTVITSSVMIANHLLARNQAVTVTSKFAATAAGLHVLPVDLGFGSWPALILTLKNRTLNPMAERFIACAREVVNSIAGKRSKRTVAKSSAV